MPEAQIDRFLMKVQMGNLSVGEEVRVVSGQKLKHPVEDLKPVLNLEAVAKLQEEVKKVDVASHVLNYIVRLVSLTRKKEEIKLGASPRASIALMKAACAWALLEGRDYVIPEDVVKLTPYVLKHRLILQPKVAIAGKAPEEIIQELVSKTAIP